jgi:superfamily I DNA/RNA helicase
VVDVWGIDGLQGYTTVPRLGRRTPLGPRQRERLWSVFAPVTAALQEKGLFTRAMVCRAVASHYAGRDPKPFDRIVVDETQDLGPAELSLLSAIAATGEDALFFAGDFGQRIFQQPFSWKALGVELRGRSSNLKVCYRTSRQIRSIADRLLPGALHDPDGNEEDRSGTISVFEGPLPLVKVLPDAAQEIEAVAGFLRSAAADGFQPVEIGVFVR